MNSEITIALISGIFTFAGILITVIAGNRKTAEQIAAQSKLTQYRIQQLEERVNTHNQLIDRMYHAEEEIRISKEKISVANHRIEDLEKKVG